MFLKRSMKLFVLLRPLGPRVLYYSKMNFPSWGYGNSNLFSAKRFCSFKNSALKNDFGDNSKVVLDGNLKKVDNEFQNNDTVETTDIEGESPSRDEIFREIAQGDPDVEKKLKKFEFEIALLEDQQFPVPSKLSPKHWKELLYLDSLASRKKYLAFLFKNEKKNNSKELKKKKSKQGLEEKSKIPESGEIEYKISGNSMFHRIYEKSASWLYKEKLMRAYLFSQHVVFDLSYETFMNKVNCKYTAHQICESFMYNYKHPAPFHVKLCNVNFDSDSFKYFTQFKPSANQSDFLWDIHKESYLDLYPKEKLVYLTPNAKSDLKTFNHDDIYIIGAFVDKGKGVKASLGKAKEENLRMAKLPLDLYLKWEKGMKSLPLNIVLGILLDMRLYENWNVALNRIPRRFLTPRSTSCKNYRKKLTYTL